MVGTMKLEFQKPSSHIAGAWYDPVTRKLRVEFQYGGSVVHEGVPESMASDFASSESPGGFHHRHLKGRYGGKAG